MTSGSRGDVREAASPALFTAFGVHVVDVVEVKFVGPTVHGSQQFRGPRYGERWYFLAIAQGLNQVFELGETIPTTSDREVDVTFVGAAEVFGVVEFEYVDGHAAGFNSSQD